MEVSEVAPSTTLHRATPGFSTERFVAGRRLDVTAQCLDTAGMSAVPLSCSCLFLCLVFFSVSLSVSSLAGWELESEFDREVLGLLFLIESDCEDDSEVEFELSVCLSPSPAPFTRASLNDFVSGALASGSNGSGTFESLGFDSGALGSNGFDSEANGLTAFGAAVVIWELAGWDDGMLVILTGFWFRLELALDNSGECRL